MQSPGAHRPGGSGFPISLGGMGSQPRGCSRRREGRLSRTDPQEPASRLPWPSNPMPAKATRSPLSGPRKNPARTGRRFPCPLLNGKSTSSLCYRYPGIDRAAWKKRHALDIRAQRAPPRSPRWRAGGWVNPRAKLLWHKLLIPSTVALTQTQIDR